MQMNRLKVGDGVIDNHSRPLRKARERDKAVTAHTRRVLMTVQVENAS